MGLSPSDVKQIGRRAGAGCLGCLGKLVVYPLLALLGTGIVLLALNAIFYPWAFHIGGRLHLLPWCQGWGKIRSASGRDYGLFIDFHPAQMSGASSPYGGGVPAIRRWGTLCTPRGDRYSLWLGGGMDKHMGSSTEGKHTNLYLNRQPCYSGFVGSWDERPRLEFQGVWHNPYLVMDDQGTLDRDFDAEGTLRSDADSARLKGTRSAQLVLREGSPSEFERACREIQAR
jgi:hypothetical protein